MTYNNVNNTRSFRSVVEISIRQDGEMTFSKVVPAEARLVQRMGCQLLQVIGFEDHLAKVFGLGKIVPIGKAKTQSDGRVRAFAVARQDAVRIFGENGGVKAAGHGQLLVTPLKWVAGLRARVIGQAEYDAILPQFLAELGVDLQEAALRTDGGCFAATSAVAGHAGVFRLSVIGQLSVHKGSTACVPDALMEQFWGADIVLLKDETEKIGDAEPGVYRAWFGATSVETEDSAMDVTGQFQQWFRWTGRLASMAMASTREALEELIESNRSLDVVLQRSRVSLDHELSTRSAAALASGLVVRNADGTFRTSKYVAEMLGNQLRHRIVDTVRTMGLDSYSSCVWVSDTQQLAQFGYMTLPSRFAARTQTDSDGDRAFFVPCGAENGEVVGLYGRYPIGNGLAKLTARELGIEGKVKLYPEGSARRAFTEELIKPENWVVSTEVEGELQPFMTSGLKINAKGKVDRSIDQTWAVVRQIRSDAEHVGGATYNLRWYLHLLNHGDESAKDKAVECGLQLEWLISGFKYGGGRGLKIETAYSKQALKDLAGLSSYRGEAIQAWAQRLGNVLPEGKIAVHMAKEATSLLDRYIAGLWRDEVDEKATCTVVGKNDALWHERIPVSAQKVSAAVSDILRFQKAWSHVWSLFQDTWHDRYCPKGKYAAWCRAKEEANDELHAAMTTLARTIRTRHHRYAFVAAMRSSVGRALLYREQPAVFYTLAGVELPYIIPAGDERDSLAVVEEGKALFATDRAFESIPRHYVFEEEARDVRDEAIAAMF